MRRGVIKLKAGWAKMCLVAMGPSSAEEYSQLNAKLDSALKEEAKAEWVEVFLSEEEVEFLLDALGMPEEKDKDKSALRGELDSFLHKLRQE